MTLFSLGGIAALAFGAAASNKIALPKNAGAGSLLIFVLFAFLSASQNGTSWLSQPDTLEYFIWMIFLGVVILIAAQSDSPSGIFLPLELLGIPLAAYGFIQHFGLDPISWSPGGNRIFSTLGNADAFGSFMSVLAAVTASRYLLIGGGGRIFLLTAEMLVICWSYTRAPLLALGAAFICAAAILLLARSLRPFLPRLGVPAMLCLGIFIGVAVLTSKTPLGQRFQTSDITTGSDTIGRIYLLKKGLEVFALHPFLGVGPGNFSYAYLPFRGGEPAFYRERLAMAESTHNAFLDAAVSTGCFGFAAFVILWISAFFETTAGMADLPLEKAGERLCLAVPLLAAFICLFFLYPDDSMKALTALLLGSAFALRTQEKKMGKFAAWGAACGALILFVAGGAIAGRKIAADYKIKAGGLRNLQSAVSLYPWNATLFQQLGKTYEEAGYPARALTSYLHATVINPKNPYPFADIGRLAAVNHWKKISLAAYANALSRDPYNPIFYHDAAVSALTLGEPMAASFFAKQALAIDPENISDESLYLEGLSQSGRNQQAAKMLHQFLQESPRNRELLELRLKPSP